jgi:hypothetical protein
MNSGAERLTSEPNPDFLQTYSCAVSHYSTPRSKKRVLGASSFRHLIRRNDCRMLSYAVHALRFLPDQQAGLLGRQVHHYM